MRPSADILDPAAAGRAGLLELDRVGEDLALKIASSPIEEARETRRGPDYEKYRRNPALWFRHKIGATSARTRKRGSLLAWLKKQQPGSHEWAWTALEENRILKDGEEKYQEQWLRAVGAHPRVALRTANGVGKTAVMAWLVLWFLDCFPGGRAVTTAGTWYQVEHQLWREIRTWRRRTRNGYRIPGDALKTRLDIDDDWFGIGLSPKDADYFEGIHGDAVLLIFDEAKSIDQGIYDAARRILKGSRYSRWVVASTPGNPSGPFWNLSGSDEWKEFHLSAYESARVPFHDIERDMREVPEDSPLFRSMICGEYFDAVLNALVPLKAAMAAREPATDPMSGFGLGCDVARFGADETVIIILKDGDIAYTDIARGQDTQRTAGRVRRLAEEFEIPDGAIAVDDTGVGGGVTDALYAQDIAVRRVNFGSAAPGPHAKQYHNMRAYLYGEAAKRIKARAVGRVTRRCAQEMAAHEYWYTPSNKLQIAPKKEVKQALGRSPDEADALVLAIYAAAAEETPGLCWI